MKTLDTSEINTYYNSIKRSAFRLEALPHYDVTDNGRFAAFDRGEAKPNSDLKGEWEQRVQTDTQAGKHWARVHLFEGEPSPYIRYELEWGYADNADAGESVYILQIPEGSEWSDWIGRDFWLFDDETVVWMEYDSEGRITARRLSNDPADAPLCSAIREKMIAAAIPYEQFMKTYKPQTN